MVSSSSENNGGHRHIGKALGVFFALHFAAMSSFCFGCLCLRYQDFRAAGQYFELGWWFAAIELLVLIVVIAMLFFVVKLPEETQ
jgi:hypothetical protein